MKKWTKKISCLILASALVVHLSGRTFALAEEPADTEDPPQIISDAPEEQDKVIDLNGQEDQESQENQKGQEDQEDQNDQQEENDLIEEVFVLSVDPKLAAGQQMLMMDRSLSEEPARAETDAGEEDRTAEVTPLLVIGEQEIDLTADSSEENWKYNSADGSVELSGLNDANIMIGTAGQGLTIKAAGFNRIGSLVIDGDINLIGSGILLVDSIEFPQDSDFNLQTNTRIYTDGTCSVAVFLKQQDGTYLLVNGEMPGVLDGDCTIPAGVSLVMPANTSLVLQSVSQRGYNDNITYSTENFGTIQYAIPDTTAPKLTISSGAALIVDQLAQILFHSISGEEVYYTGLLEDIENRYAVTFAPSIRVEGELELNSGVTNAILSFGSDASFSGEGVISNSSIDVDGNRQQTLSTLHVSDSNITLNGDATLEGLVVEGNSSLLVKGNTTIGSILMEDGSTLTCSDNKGFSENHTVTVTGAITAEERVINLPSGGAGPIDFSGLIDSTITLPGAAEIHLRSGIYVLASGSSVSGVQFSSRWQWNENTAIQLYSGYDASGTAALFNYSGNDITTDLMICENGTGSPNGPASSTLFPLMIPVTAGAVGNVGDAPVSSAFLAKENSPVNANFPCMSDTKLTKSLLSKSFEYCHFVLEIVNPNGSYSLVKVTDDTSISALYVKHIYAYDVQPLVPLQQGGGGSATNTSALFTGNGNLGGQAGSTTGGSSTRLFGGSGITNPVTSQSTSSGNTPGEGEGSGNIPDEGGDSGNIPGEGGDSGNIPGEDGDSGNAPGEGGDSGNAPGEDGDNVDNSAGREDTAKDSETENSSSEKENVTEQVVVLDSETLILRIEPEADAKEEDTVFILTARNEAGGPVLEFTKEIVIRMNYRVPAEQKGWNIYVVFLNEEGMLEAIRAKIDQISGKLVFKTDKPIGRFVVIALEFDGEEFSPAFFEMLNKLPKVGALK